MIHEESWQTIWSAVPAYAAWVLLVAAAVYGATRFLGRHLSPDKRDTLALWLLGAIEDSWPRHFCDQFDRVFGERHLSMRCFQRSALASLVFVVSLYVLLGFVLGILETRAIHGMFDPSVSSEVTSGPRWMIWDALVLGALVNVLADYVSLLETRWVLHRMSRARSTILYAPWLVIDFVLSGIIIWGAIAFYAIFRGGDVPSLVDLLAFFSPLSLFFYSSFLTSIWSWLYALSTWLLRLFTRLGLNRVLDVENHPAEQVAFVVSALMVIAGIGMGGLVLPRSFEGERPVARLDLWLCSKFQEQACFGVMRQEIVRAIAACKGDDKSACERFRADRERACERGSVGACVSLAHLRYYGIGLEADRTRAAAHAERACALGDPTMCSMFGRALVQGDGVERDEAAAVPFLDRACRQHRPVACYDLGNLLLWGQGVERDEARAAALYRRACNTDMMMGCHNLGMMLAEGRGIEPNIEAAKALFRRACDGGQEVACEILRYVPWEELTRAKAEEVTIQP